MGFFDRFRKGKGDPSPAIVETAPEETPIVVEVPESEATAVELPEPVATVAVEVLKEEPRFVTMSLDGIPVEVPVTEIPRFQARGFLLHSPSDLPGMAGELKALAAELPRALDAFVVRSMEEKSIDASENAELHVLIHTWNMLDAQLQTVLKTAYGHFPIKEADSK